MAKIQWIWARLNANYWFYPALFATIGAILAFTLIYVDRNGFAQWLNDVPWIVPARPGGASNMLTVISGSMIGVASTVFSITIAAVAYASGNYGPRLLTNFMEDKGNQLSLATFIGTFVYAITVLRTVRAEDEAAATVSDAAATSLPGFVPQLSLLVAYGLMGLSVAVLVFFLNHIPSSIRINHVLEGIGSRLIEGVKEAYPEDNTGKDAPQAPEGGQAVLAERTGYVQIVDFDGLIELAEERDVRLSLEVRTGDFVHPGMTLLRVVGEQTDDLKIGEYFTFGATRTPKQDPQFLIDELVEIGLRALSPGINDPFTAITALHWMGAATVQLGKRELVKMSSDDSDEEQRVFPLPDDFDHYLRRGFGAIRSAVSTSHTASLVMLDTLRQAAASIEDDSRKMLLRREGDRLIDQVRTHLQGPDMEDVEARYVAFTQALPA